MISRRRRGKEEGKLLIFHGVLCLHQPSTVAGETFLFFCGFVNSASSFNAPRFIVDVGISHKTLLLFSPLDHSYKKYPSTLPKVGKHMVGQFLNNKSSGTFAEHNKTLRWDNSQQYIFVSHISWFIVAISVSMKASECSAVIWQHTC